MAKIRLKFCGGCNPGYDRLAVAEHIRSACGHHVQLVATPDTDVAGVLVIAGCRTACVDLEPFKELPVYRITGEESVFEICRALLQIQAIPRNPETTFNLRHADTGARLTAERSASDDPLENPF